MMIYLTNIIMIMIILAYIIDHSGITTDISKKIYQLINKNKEWKGQIIKTPFTCLSCACFWLITIFTYFTFYNIIIALFVGCISAILSKLFSILIGKIIITILKLK